MKVLPHLGTGSSIKEMFNIGMKVQFLMTMEALFSFSVEHTDFCFIIEQFVVGDNIARGCGLVYLV
jgi:hypothetical protein